MDEISVRINNMGYNAFFDSLHTDEKSIRRKIEDFWPSFHFSYNDLPAFAPREIPRLIGNSEHGHSQLSFTMNSITLMSYFDDTYSQDVGKSMRYVSKKLDSIKKLQDEMNYSNNYFGLTANYIFEIDPWQVLGNNIVNFHTDEILYNMALRVAVVLDERYFINVELAGVKVYGKENGILHDALGVVVDINNRYAFDNRKGADQGTDMQKIETLHRMMVEDKLRVLIKTGELMFHD